MDYPTHLPVATLASSRASHAWVCSFVLVITTIVNVGVCAGQSASPANRSVQKGRSTIEQKIDSQLLTAMARRSARDRATPGVVRIDARDRALVDVRAEVTRDLERAIRSSGGDVVSTSAEYRSIVAWLPLSRIRVLAARTDVIAINPASEPARQ